MQPQERSLLARYTNLPRETQIKIQWFLASLEWTVAALMAALTYYGLVTGAHRFEAVIPAGAVLVLLIYSDRRRDLIEFLEHEDIQSQY